MISVEMDNAAVKGFMGQLLREDILDEFEVRGVEIGLATRISINGALEASITAETETSKPTVVYITWEALRPLIYTIIKTGAKPSLVKIVFSYKAQDAKTIHTNAAALFLNMVYENDAISFTTATAQKEFALDKSLDDSWDGWIRGFFTRKNITVADRT